MNRAVVGLRSASGCECCSGRVIGARYCRWWSSTMELKGLVQNTQYSVEVEGVIREVLSDILLRASSKDRHLCDSVDAVLEERERLASG
jgi:hypothetical protein